MARTPVISSHDLAAGYASGKQKKIILSHIQIEIFPGEIVCLAGANGIGKSTLLKTLAGLLPPVSGSIMLKGKPVVSYTRQEIARLISVVLTTRIPIGNLRAREVVALGRYPYTNWLGLHSAEDEEKIKIAFGMTGTRELESMLIYELSDGQLQKIMVARALAQDSEVILLDEPTAHLDLHNKISIMKLLKDLSSKTGKGILVATHELELAFQVSDRLILIRENGTLESGTPEDLILKGSIDSFMNYSSVIFDKSSGKFLPVRSPGPALMVHGTGIPYVWTKNALERSGYSVAREGSEYLAAIHIDIKNDRVFWTIKYQNTMEIVYSIESLLNCLDKFFLHV
ncbi:MAG TPA: ABC transporter ATP-binding protein [Cyclobacteriaceae bacterium]|nr:ABC transporter ATP-binding protein [Cyclobacteriaceae bacterium]